MAYYELLGFIEYEIRNLVLTESDWSIQMSEIILRVSRDSQISEWPGLEVCTCTDEEDELHL